MIISRSSAFVRLHSFAGKNFLQNTINNLFSNSKRGHGNLSWYYRKIPKPTARELKSGEYFGAFIWWWITWHLVTDYEELLPHPFPDPSKWTDEELGIPPINL